MVNLSVCLTNKYKDWSQVATGKGMFANRLMSAMKGLGVFFTQNPKDKVDIDLSFSKHVYIPKNAKKRVLRCGAIHYDLNMKDLKGHNREHGEALKRCEGVIYQSEFSKKLWDRFVGYHPKHETVIFNGADPQHYKIFYPYPSKYKYNFLASTREWIHEKRLKDIIKSFLMADIKDSCLWICGNIQGKPHKFPDGQGDLPKKYKGKPVKFLGACSQETVGRLYRLCNVMIHIVYWDACANSVAEALSAGLPVICGNNCGTMEMIKENNGTIVEFEKDYPLKAWNRRKPPKINKEQLAAAITKYAKPKEEFIAEHVNINNIAQKYLNFFEKVLQ